MDSAAEVEILISVKQQGMEAFKDARDAVNDLKTAQAGLWASQTLGWGSTANLAAITSVATAATTTQTIATQAATAAAGQGAYAWLAMAAGIAAAVAVLSPFIIYIGSAAAILVTFAITAAATLALLGGLAAGFTAIGAAVLSLGITGLGGMTATSGPVAKLVNDFDAMKKTLEQQAAPLATMILLWADKFIPVITQAGQAIMTWFGDRLAGALNAIGGIINTLTPTFILFAQFVGAAFDKAFGATAIGPSGTIVTLGQLFTQTIQMMVGPLQGLINNLLLLENWFLVRLPSFKGVASDVFGVLGTVVQGAAQIWGKFADWLVQNWPAIVDLATRAVNDIALAWAAWQPFLQQSAERWLPLIPPLLKFVADNAGALVPILMTVLAVFMAVSVVVLAVAGSVEFLVRKLQDFATAWANSPIGRFANFAQNIGSGGGTQPNAGGGARGVGPRGGANVNININGNQSPAATALAVGRIMQRALSV